ncbi:MAG TPA: S9 family peptidase [Gemmataceae bacterium]|nr:S9 family peptidase [Gemmataceae bacterium]
MRLIFACLLLLFAPAFVHAQPTAKRAITVDDYFSQADLFGVAYSPKWTAYVEGRWQESTDDRKTELWIVPSQGGTPRRLTSDRASSRAPQWAHGNNLYYLANRKRDGEKRPPYDGKAQVWRINVDGGSSQPITHVDGGVDAYQVARDHWSLYYLVHVDKTEDDWSGLRSKYSKLEYGHGQNRLGQIWKLDLTSYRAEKIIDAGRTIREFTVSPDGKRIAMITTPDDKVVSFEGKSRVDVWDAASGKITTVPEAVYRKQMPSPYAWLEGIAWNTAGTALAFGVIFDGYPAEIVIADLRDKEPQAFKMPRPTGIHVRGYGSPLQWVAGKDDLWFLAEEKGRVRLTIAEDVLNDREGKNIKHVAVTPGDVVVESFSASQNSETPMDYAVTMATPTSFADVYAYNVKKKFSSGKFLPVLKLQKLVHVNPQADSWKLPQLSVVSWKGARGDQVEGILELPPDYKKGDKVPLVVEIHGGPTTATYFKLQYWIYGRTLLPAKGYAVLCPNYRGSTGYGDKFTADLIGHENNLDVEDILKGVDALVERGIADPDKLAVTGWSNGGYLTNCLITKTPRFKAAISGAGIVDAIMEWGSNDEPAYAMVFKQGLPWTNPEKYHKASSTYQLGNIKTPTLIHVGGNDDRCPPGHSKMLYRALKEYLHVPTELVVYPGEGHGIMKYRNRRAKLEWDLAWLDRHVMGKKK